VAATARCPRAASTPDRRAELSDLTPWHPTDDELDELARSLPPVRPEAERLERNRDAILAASRDMSQHPARARARTLVALGVPLAAAAAVAVALWFARDTGSEPSAVPTMPGPKLGTEPDAPPPIALARVLVTPRTEADFEDSGDSADRVVSLRDGEIMVEVANLATDNRFRTMTADAEIETFHARFSAAASESRLTGVVVYEGRVELRPDGRVMSASDWAPPSRQRERDSRGRRSLARAGRSVHARRAAGEPSRPNPQTWRPPGAAGAAGTLARAACRSEPGAARRTGRARVSRWLDVDASRRARGCRDVVRRRVQEGDPPRDRGGRLFLGRGRRQARRRGRPRSAIPEPVPPPLPQIVARRRSVGASGLDPL
jgi:hypothetical protein